MTIISAIILLGILIFVHELGHFLFAKLMGVKVLKFSLGFGKKLIAKKYGETEYQIAAFPLGGYVKMFGEESGEEMRLTGDKEEEPATKEDLTRAFSAQPVWKRFLIVLAGPAFNIFFASVIFAAIFMYSLRSSCKGFLFSCQRSERSWKTRPPRPPDCSKATGSPRSTAWR
jgi:regulator of sigma E protease